MLRIRDFIFFGALLVSGGNSVLAQQVSGGGEIGGGGTCHGAGCASLSQPDDCEATRCLAGPLEYRNIISASFSGTNMSTPVALAGPHYHSMRSKEGALLYSLKSFLELDSGLRDCSIPFERLRAESPDCKGFTDQTSHCEGYSPSQFTEVVKVTSDLEIESVRKKSLCTGTLVAINWVLIAAHCFLDHSVTELRTSGDLSISNGKGIGISVNAINALALPEFERTHRAINLIINAGYGGIHGASAFHNDVALIELEKPYSPVAVDPASIATTAQDEATIAGVGFSNKNGGMVGKFDLTWIDNLKNVGDKFEFYPKLAPTIRAAFCKGDSGGPVFAGYYRGCRSDDLVPETRPHLLQGIISANRIEEGFDRSSAGAKQWVEMCRNGSLMVMQNIAEPSMRKWICDRTKGAASGC